MICSHCDHQNPEDETRCQRCGRRLSSAPGESSADWLIARTTGNLAAAPARSRIPAAEVPQRTLFPERQVSNVIPFETLAIGGRSAAARTETALAPPRPEAPQAPVRPRRPVPANRASDTQQELELLPLAPPAPRTLKTRVEASIYCDAPVATLMHRGVAAALDFSLVVIGYGLLVLAFYFVTGDLGVVEVPVTRLTLIAFGAAFVMLWGFYGLLWGLANRETPGMRATHLRFSNFDGYPPELAQRLLRCCATCLSIATFGFGLLWALVDEESLTWQDHISKTFPTFRRAETNFYRRR